LYGWRAIIGGQDVYGNGYGEFLWYPEVFFISLGVALWIAVFDINYARMDIESDIKNEIHSFPSRFGDEVTTRTSIQLTLLWFACFAISNPANDIWFLIAAGVMCVLNIGVIVYKDRLPDFQTTLFRVSMLTGWALLAAIMITDPSTVEKWSSDV
jgi:4-hydroxybenzoate polyprenyltransferase